MSDEISLRNSQKPPPTLLSICYMGHGEKMDAYRVSWRLLGYHIHTRVCSRPHLRCIKFELAKYSNPQVSRSLRESSSRVNSMNGRAFGVIVTLPFTYTNVYDAEAAPVQLVAGVVAGVLLVV